MQHTSRIAIGTFSLFTLSLALSGANCIWPFIEDKPRLAVMRTFDSAEELRQFLVEQAQQRMNGNRSGGIGLFPTFFATAAMEDNASGVGDTGGQQLYSTTNVQEVGVDESDLVKNDGQYIYWLKDRKIHVVQAFPADAMQEVATIDLDAHGDSLYLKDDRLVAISNNWGCCWLYEWDSGPVRLSAASAGDDGTAASDTDIVGGPWNDGNQVTVTIINVADPANPIKEQTIELEGQLANSRLIDNKLHLILTSLPQLPANPTTDALEDMTLEEWLPNYRTTSSAGSTSSGVIAPWNTYWAPIQGDGYAITTITTLDISDPDAGLNSTAITANAGSIYASTQAIYVTDTQYDWNSFTSASRTDTMIHKLRFTQTGSEYAASGLVPGRPLNQYSLGEHDGYLRIATTDDSFDPTTGGAQSSGVYVLGEEAGSDELAIVGKIEDIAPGEQIYAARFLGPRGFLVTFRRVDPLFTLDLSNPADPKIAGELKVPGYSDHIQLLDENHLLTIGKDTMEANGNVWVQGVALSIFDISDFNNPLLAFKKVIGGRGTNSEANYNPKAFNYFAPQQALALPIDIYSQTAGVWDYGQHHFSGLMVLRVSPEDGFQELGSISFFDQASQNGCYLAYYGAGRGVFIGDTVYAVSDVGVKAAALSDIANFLSTVSFGNQADYRYCNGYNVGTPEILPSTGGGLR